MSVEVKFVLKFIADNVFWLFLLLMIVLGTALDTPFINVGLTAR
jgi:hypothetical protein